MMVRFMVMEGAGDFGTETASLPADDGESTPKTRLRHRDLTFAFYA